MSKGDRLLCERRPTQWEGWLWCSASGGRMGWVPEAWLEVCAGTGVMLRDYDAQELAVQPGNLLREVLTAADWLLARTASGTEGWVPLSCVERAGRSGAPGDLGSVAGHQPERAVQAEVVVAAPLDLVWSAWTTDRGAETFLAPRCRIEARPGGRFEPLFDLEAEPGNQGAEGMIVLAVQPREMLSFTWNAPPSLPAVRGQMTHVTVRFRAVGADHTEVRLQHGGWGEGGEWEDARAYFGRAWAQVVLPRLEYRFRVGPVDWGNPPAVAPS